MKRNSILLCLLLAIAANTFTTAKAQAVNVHDSLALVDLYNSTDGPHWKYRTNWLTTKPVSTWYRVTVTNNRVTSLGLQTNRLKGPIPPSIGNLVMLSTLFLYGNGLSGAIPNSIGNLKNLYYLELSGNVLNRTIPASIGNLANLYELDLSHNLLSGVIPASIGNLANLVNLYLQENHLSGAIPDTLGQLKKLGTLILSYNRLSGAIPASVEKLRNCFIYLNNNQLSQFGYFHSFKDTIYAIIEHNRFTFDGLQVAAAYYPYVTYAPQDTVLPINQNGNTLSVSAGGTLSNNTYTWYKAGDTGKTIIKRDSTFIPAQSGMYYVTVTNKIVKFLVLYSDTVSYTMPLAQAESRVANVAAVKVANMHFSIYPNPASNIIHIQINGTSIITLTNSDGKVLLTKTINSKGDINVSAFANGTYYIQNKTTGEVEKIVVVH